MTVDIRPIPRLGWDPLPYEGCVGVVGRVLVREDDFFVAQLASREETPVATLDHRRFSVVKPLHCEAFTFVP